MNGCPVCGYSGALESPGFQAFSDARVGASGPAAPLPWWLWLAGLTVLAAAVLGLAAAVLR